MAAKTRQSKNTLPIIFDRESDGRWIAEIPRVPGALAYGKTKPEARLKAKAIALRALADRIEQNQSISIVNQLFVSA